jgi:hypothetical protein
VTTAVAELGGSLDATSFLENAKTFEATAPKAKSGGVPIMRLNKSDGVWVYGADSVEVEEDSQWVIPPDSLLQGYIAWHGGKVEGEKMATIGAEPVSPNALPPVNAKNGWEEQVGFGLVCITGEDTDTKAVFKTNTKGGIEAWNNVFDAIKARAVAGKSFTPIVKLTHSSYQHSEYGKIRKPVFEVVGWHGDEAAGAIESDDEAPKRRKPRSEA